MHDGELLVVLPADLVGQAALGIGARTAGLDPDVGPLDALEEDLLAGGAGGVDGDGILVAVVLAPREGAAGLAGDGRSLGLQNLRAHLGHEAAGEGAGNVRAGDEDLNALEDAEGRILVEFLSQFVVDFFHVRMTILSVRIALNEVDWSEKITLWQLLPSCARSGSGSRPRCRR